MKKLKIENFDVAKIGEMVSLNQIKGGVHTYRQTGSSTSASGETYKDWENDSGSHACDELDGTAFDDMNWE